MDEGRPAASSGGAGGDYRRTTLGFENSSVYQDAIASELVYVLEGSFRFQIDDDIHETPADSTIFIPRGLPHSFQNADERPGRLLHVFTPAGMERFFALTGGDRARFEAAGAELGMEVVGPPLR